MSLHTIAAIRTLAEERAREFYDHAFSDYDAEGFRKLRGKERARWILAFHKQLCDLTRPDSRDAVARLVAPRIGWDAFDVTKAIEVSTGMLAGLYRVAGLPELPRWEPVPSPAEALARVAIAVLA